MQVSVPAGWDEFKVKREEVFEFALDARDGVQVTTARAGRWQGEVHPLGIEART